MPLQRNILLALALALPFLPNGARGAVPPASNFDLSHWKLTLPIDAAGGVTGEAVEIKQPQIQTYSSQFFYTDPDGAMVFWCPVIGATTTSATAPRSELREVINAGDSSVNWTGYGTHILRGQCRVTQLPDTGAVIIGQVHGYPVQRLVKLQYDAGRVQVYVRNSLTASGDTKFTWSVTPGALINYEIKVVDGVAYTTVNGVTTSANFFASDPAWISSLFYFKAGAYLQDNSGPTTEGGRVSFYQLSATHPAPGTPPAITSQPLSQTVAQNAAVTLSVGVSGTGPFLYQWRTNGFIRPDWTNSSLSFPSFRAANQMNYDVTVRGPAGAVTSSVASLYLNSPLRMTNARMAGGRFNTQLIGVAGRSYVLQSSTNLTLWTSIATQSSPNGIVTFAYTNAPGGRRFYRAR